MPKATEICVVVADGQRYDNWESVECIRTAEDVIDHCMLTVAEFSDKGAFTGNISNVKLKPGDPAQVYLAGQLVLNGRVYLRQGVLDPNRHGVQIGIASNSQSIIPSTVDAAPGQYKNQNVQQIASACFGKVGVGFSIEGSPGGAEKIFPRVSEHVGETRFNFIERLCRMRNLHMMDDGQGGIVAFRGPKGSAPSVVKEGFNLLHGRVLLKNDEHVEPLTAVGQNYSQDTADDNRDPEANTNIDGSVNRPMKFPAEEPGDKQDMQLRVNHESDWVKHQLVDGEVTVQGWLCPDGSLWWGHVREVISVVSPSILPGDSMPFMIKGVSHRQSDEEGTTTTIFLCREDGLGAGGEPLGGSGPLPSTFNAG